MVASGAKIILSKLPIGDVATQYFADRYVEDGAMLSNLLYNIHVLRACLLKITCRMQTRCFKPCPGFVLWQLECAILSVLFLRFLKYRLRLVVDK